MIISFRRLNLHLRRLSGLHIHWPSTRVALRIRSKCHPDLEDFPYNQNFFRFLLSGLNRWFKFNQFFLDPHTYGDD